MVAIYVDMSQVERFAAQLANEGVDVEARVTPAVATTAAIVMTRATAEAPRLTGALAGSIRPTGGGLRWWVKAGNARAYYARYQEFGTRKMAANPFLLKQANAAAQAAFENRVAAAITRGGVFR